MGKPKLKVLVGLPASGKSTAAKELEKQGWVRVNKDTIRKELFGDNWTHKKEKEVVKEETEQITAGLKSGKDVVVDSTNLNPSHISRFKRLARELEAEMDIDSSFLEVPLAELIRRDKEREETVGEQVIRGMFHKWVKKMPTFYDWVEGREICIISDIDGTLTLGPKNRSPYEWHKVGNDDLNEATAAILDSVRIVQGERPNLPVKTFLFSGRDSVCRPETVEWLDKNCIDYDELFMRPEGDNRSDVDIKLELFNEHIRDKYNVLFVLDDRPRVVQLWNDVLGLNVFAVGDQRHDF